MKKKHLLRKLPKRKHLQKKRKLLTRVARASSFLLTHTLAGSLLSPAPPVAAAAEDDGSKDDAAADSSKGT